MVQINWKLPVKNQLKLEPITSAPRGSEIGKTQRIEIILVLPKV